MVKKRHKDTVSNGASGLSDRNEISTRIRNRHSGLPLKIDQIYFHRDSLSIYLPSIFVSIIYLSFYRSSSKSQDFDCVYSCCQWAAMNVVLIFFLEDIKKIYKFGKETKNGCIGLDNLATKTNPFSWNPLLYHLAQGILFSPGKFFFEPVPEGRHTGVTSVFFFSPGPQKEISGRFR